ncbi:hypothetical protein IR120_12800, partial [Muribacter muris]|nr:hypothetical protein [Muribacter muris]
QTFKQDKLIYQRHSVFHGRELLAQQDSYQDKHTTHYAVSQPNDMTAWADGLRSTTSGTTQRPNIFGTATNLPLRRHSSKTN